MKISAFNLLAPDDRDALKRYLEDVRALALRGIDVRQTEDVVVPLGAGKGCPVFAFPPGSGYSFGYGTLAGMLPSVAFFGFNFIEARSRLRRYADHIKRLAPSGPFILFGYSAGGKLAFQAAVELERRNEKVDAIVMLGAARYTGRPHRSEEVQNDADNVLEGMTSTVLKQRALGKIRSYRSFIAGCVETDVVDAPIHLVIEEGAKDPMADSSGRFVATLSGWRELTRGSFKMYQGAGKHAAMLDLPHLGDNVEILEKIFKRLA